MLAKIEDGKIVYPKIINRKIEGNGRVIYNPRKEDLIELGFREYIPTEKPEQREGFDSFYMYEVVDSEIVGHWEEYEVQDEPVA